MVQSYIVLLPHFVYSPTSPVNLSPFPQISSISTTLTFKEWNTVWMQMEMKKIPTKTPQTISLNKALLSLSIYFPLSFYHFPLSDISPFIPKTRYGLTLRHMRPLLTGLKAMMITEPYFPLIIYFSLSSIIKTKKH
jgi:hypothetical protein